MPDYTKYSLEELHDAYSVVDKEKYPQNYQSIINEISLREKECESLYLSAVTALEQDGDQVKARQLFQKVVNKFPRTENAKNAKKFLKGDLKNLNTDTELGEYINSMKLEFSGSTREYFRIWIVNLCLSLLTLGIYSAWAKVRKKRYIYSHLTLDETPFQYLGLPIPILRGRIIAAIVFLIYFSSDNLFPAALPYVFAAGLLVAPWVFVQSVAFNARYTAFRNMTFRFNASHLDAFKVLSAWGIIPAIIIGTIFAWWGSYWIAALVYIPASFLFPGWLKEIKKLIVTKTSFGGISGEFKATGGDFFGIYLVVGLTVFFIGLCVAFSVFVVTKITSLENVKNMAYVITAISYMGYLLAYAYIQANITNTVWNKINIGPVSFHCTLKTTELAKIYITNVLGIICTAGILIPWAVIRTLKYRIDNTQIQCNGELNAFLAQESKGVHATGSEITEFFDMDLSI